MDPLVATRLIYSVGRFKALRPILEPLFHNAIGATNRLYDHSATKQPDEVTLLIELSHIYAGALLEVCAAFFRRMANWSNKPAGIKLNLGFEVNWIGITLASLAGSNNHKHWREWNTYEQTGKPFTRQ